MNAAHTPKPPLRPTPKNPQKRTPPMTLPPGARGRTALGMTSAAAEGRFALQVCQACGTVQYPARELCGQCLDTALVWQDQDGAGVLLSATTLHHSNDPYFRDRLPWRIGSVQLAVGPTVIAHLTHEVATPTSADERIAVRVRSLLDRSGHAVLVAAPQSPTNPSSELDDPMLREMTCHPQHRNILITQGDSPLGLALTQAVLKAGARHVWVGRAQAWKVNPSFEQLLATHPQVTLLPLDLGQERSVELAAAQIGGKVDILINNAEVHRPYGLQSRRGVANARAEMEINYFGLLRLAQAFAPILKARAADGVAHAVAWVNVLSVFALTNWPEQATYSASQAAAWSLSQALRADLLSAGIRTVQLFPGPMDDEWNQAMPPPKVSPLAVAQAVVQALRDGVEDVYLGDIAQDLRQRWRQDPKVLERELAAGGL